MRMHVLVEKGKRKKKSRNGFKSGWIIHFIWIYYIWITEGNPDINPKETKDPDIYDKINPDLINKSGSNLYARYSCNKVQAKSQTSFITIFK